MPNELVSIIMPVHNEEQYLRYALSSVLNQTYQNWELLVIDDCSTDTSPMIIKEFAAKDHRIKVFRNNDPTKKIPAKPRNIGIYHATGRFITFLDSDDQWLPTKLEHQLQLFEREKEAVIVFSNYKRMNYKGKVSHHIVKAPLRTSYHELLKSNVMGCLTVMYDTNKVGKQFCPVCGYDDYALWLSILRNGSKGYNTNTVEALYRVKKRSVSSNKFRDMGWQWHIYRHNEKLPLFPSIYYFANYAVRAFCKRLK